MEISDFQQKTSESAFSSWLSKVLLKCPWQLGKCSQREETGGWTQARSQLPGTPMCVPKVGQATNFSNQTAKIAKPLPWEASPAGSYKAMSYEELMEWTADLPGNSFSKPCVGIRASRSASNLSLCFPSGALLGIKEAIIKVPYLGML